MAASKRPLQFCLFLVSICGVLAQDRGRRLSGDLESRNLVGPGVQINITEQYEEDKISVEQESGKPERFLSSDSGPLAAVATLLQRQGERLSVLHNLAEQQMRRLDTLEYRLTRLEVQGQERIEATRVSKAEEARHVQNLMYQVGQLSSALESLRQSHVEERQTIATLAAASATTSTTQGVLPTDVFKRLQGLANLVQGVRVAVTGVADQQAIFRKNFTDIMNITRQTRVAQEQLVSRRLFTSTLAELRYSSPSTCPLHVTALQKDSSKLPEDCAEVQREVGYNKSGIYLLQSHPLQPSFFAYCDLTTRGGGWTVFQNRFEGSIDFYRDWLDYKRGFGNIGGEFWLGLEKLHTITASRMNELMIEMEDFATDTKHAHYASFAVGPEVEDYPIVVLADYDGDAGDSMVYHSGMKFSTRDADNDQWPDSNCAEIHSGAWWYNGCDTSNLNGRYLHGDVPDDHEYKGMYWYEWHGPAYSLKSTRMMVRPRGFEADMKKSKEIKGAAKRGGGTGHRFIKTTTPLAVPSVDVTTESPTLTTKLDEE